MSVQMAAHSHASSPAHAAHLALDADNKLPLGKLDLSAETCDLRLHNISKHYEDFALQSVTLEVPRGSVVGLVGRNGAGKTTLMRIALGSVRADAGTIELFGTACQGLSHKERATLKAHIGYVSSVCPYPAYMSVAQVVHMYALAYKNFDKDLLSQLFERMGLFEQSTAGARTDKQHNPILRKQVGKLSRGMSMKLQLACVLASGAELLVMDEPTAGLDPIVRDELLDILRESMEDGKHSLLISSHITSDLEHLADYIVMIDKGAIAFATDRDRIVEEMGIAHLHSDELDQLINSGYIPAGQMRVLKHDYSWDVLVANRAEFTRRFPSFAVDGATIDETMNLIAKGAVR